MLCYAAACIGRSLGGSTNRVGAAFCSPVSVQAAPQDLGRTRSMFLRALHHCIHRGYHPFDMRRAVASSIVMVVLAAAILSVAVIASTRSSDDTTELLKLLPNGLPDISGIQTEPATKAQIAAQMKKDGLSLNLFKQVPVSLHDSRSGVSVCNSFAQHSRFIFANTAFAVRI
jgi:hypothetical protein